MREDLLSIYWKETQEAKGAFSASGTEEERELPKNAKEYLREGEHRFIRNKQKISVKKITDWKAARQLIQWRSCNLP